MSDPKLDEKDPDEKDLDEKDLDEDPMRALLKRSLEVKREELPAKPTLAEVQRKIRERSKGKFYNDGWSTSAQKVNYALVAVLMLLVVALAYFALGPVGLSAH
jgi:hypothetical protein